VQVFGLDVGRDPRVPSLKWTLAKEQAPIGGSGSTANITDIRSNWLIGGSIGYAAASIEGSIGILVVDTSAGVLISFIRSAGLEPRRTTIG